MKILFKFATRSRPQKFFSCLENIINTVESDNYQILVSADEDDETMAWDKIKDRYDLILNSVDGDVNRVITHHGKSKNKIEAINRDFEYIRTWDILINTSDDMNFVRKGFDNIIRKDMTEQFPDLDGFLHYNDGNQRDRVATMSIMGRKYYERFNYIYHPSYESLFCDEEATEVAKRLGRHRYMGDIPLFKHLHPAWGLGEYDEQYQRTESRKVWIADENNFIERKARNFDL